MRILSIFWILFGFLIFSVWGLNLPQGQQIGHISFIGDKLFYISGSRRIFGFISAENGEFMTTERVKQNEAIIRIDKEFNKIIIRRGRNKAIVLCLTTLNIHNLHIDINFQHQRLVDLVETNQKIYVLTSKDFRIYDRESSELSETSENIISSCKKKEWFLKMFIERQEQEEAITIVLLSEQIICLRKIWSGGRTDQNCYFTITSDIVWISSYGGNFLVQSKLLNYVITKAGKVYSFNAAIFQISENFAILSQRFKSFDFSNYKAIEGLVVSGSTEEHVFLLRKINEDKIEIYYNGVMMVAMYGIGSVIRSWVSWKSPEAFNLILQISTGKLTMYELTPSQKYIKQIWPIQKAVQQQVQIIDEDL